MKTFQLATPLPPALRYYLLFSYGGGARLLGDANDGAVTLASQLDSRAQLQAAKVMGFNASHRSVLRSPAVADELNRLFAAAGR